MAEFPKFDEKIAKNMRMASLACYKNGNGLLEEANILYDRDRYARATALAILAEEELSKAMILQLCLLNERWDKELYSGLVIHEQKQAMSGALSALMEDFKLHMSRAKFSFINMPFNFKFHANEETKKAKKTYIEDQKKDKRKQDAQFVAIGRTGLPCRTPDSFTKKDANVEIDSAIMLRAYIEALYGNRKDNDPLFRGSTTIQKKNGEVTIYHKSGITVRIVPFAWADNGCEADKVNMNPHIILPELPSLDPGTLDEEQKANLANIYKAYDFPGQIRAEMKKLGLRGTDYLEEVEALIKKYNK